MEHGKHEKSANKMPNRGVRRASSILLQAPAMEDLAVSLHVGAHETCCWIDICRMIYPRIMGVGLIWRLKQQVSEFTDIRNWRYRQFYILRAVNSPCLHLREGRG